MGPAVVRHVAAGSGRAGGRGAVRPLRRQRRCSRRRTRPPGSVGSGPPPFANVAAYGDGDCPQRAHAAGPAVHAAGTVSHGAPGAVSPEVPLLARQDSVDEDPALAFLREDRPGWGEDMQRLQERVFGGIADDVRPRGPPAEAAAVMEDDVAAIAVSGPSSFSPQVRRRQLSELVGRTTLSRMHEIPQIADLEATRAAALCGRLWPWEWEQAEPPIPNEYWEMSQAERRFLGLPWKEAAHEGAEGLWQPPQAGFTEAAADSPAFAAVAAATEKVRRAGGDKRLLTREEIGSMQDAEAKVADHLRARLDDMAPFLRERGAAWRERRRRIRAELDADPPEDAGVVAAAAPAAASGEGAVEGAAAEGPPAGGAARRPPSAEGPGAAPG
eukprot:TRINITY_DN65850_c0_g1_i1.p1 TRINITY_DN65850_c0_g1~~TRINITY_DN65850_c0_g1_i1.p1  ORF type:complete len:385 (+),score=58.27 TRINITY_DN65850_c0_g1_i1:142-1296(+)